MSLRVRSGVVSSIESDKDLKKVLKESKTEGYATPRADAAINKVLKQLKEMNAQIDSINAGLSEQKAKLAAVVAAEKGETAGAAPDTKPVATEPISDGAALEQKEKIKEGGTEE